MELAIVSHLRLNTKIMYLSPSIFFKRKCIFFKGDNTNNLNVSILNCLVGQFKNINHILIVYWSIYILIYIS